MISRPLPNLCNTCYQNSVIQCVAHSSIAQAITELDFDSVEDIDHTKVEIVQGILTAYLNGGDIAMGALAKHMADTNPDTFPDKGMGDAS